MGGIESKAKGMYQLGLGHDSKLNDRLRQFFEGKNLKYSIKEFNPNSLTPYIITPEGEPIEISNDTKFIHLKEGSYIFYMDLLKNI